MIINHNIGAMNTHRRLSLNTENASKSMEKLSSGQRINRAADDAAGLSISEKMRSQIRGLGQASRNAQDGISLVQTAEGALNEVSDMLVRAKELAVQASSGTYNASDLKAINDEYTALKSAIDDTATKTKFNGNTLLNLTSGSTTAGGAKGNYEVTIQIGVDKGDEVKITNGDIQATTASGLGLSKTGTGMSSSAAAQNELAKIDTAIGKVNQLRSDYGAVQNRLEHTRNNVDTTTENLQAAESRVRDVDMAKEMMKFTKDNILTQAATSMLAQANQQPQGVLSLLR